MADEKSECDDVGHQAAKRALRRGMLLFSGYILLMAVLMFWPAGGLGWVRGWVFLVIYVATGIVAVTYLWHTNPEIVVARSVPHQGAKGWDFVPFLLLLVLFLAMFPVAGLDDGRFHWSVVPLWLTVVGYVVMLLGTAGNVWVMRVNKFAEPRVRIQTEREHKVIDSGPYAIVRHPFYVTAFFLCVGMPLALGSLWALVPGALAAVVLVVRTVFEDRMLKRELEGYRDYAARVRYRLLPGVW